MDSTDLARLAVALFSTPEPANSDEVVVLGAYADESRALEKAGDDRQRVLSSKDKAALIRADIEVVDNWVDVSAENQDSAASKAAGLIGADKVAAAQRAHFVFRVKLDAEDKAYLKKAGITAKKSDETDYSIREKKAQDRFDIVSSEQKSSLRRAGINMIDTWLGKPRVKDADKARKDASNLLGDDVVSAAIDAGFLFSRQKSAGVVNGVETEGHFCYDTNTGTWNFHTPKEHA